MAVADPNTEARRFTEHLDPMIEALAEHVRPTGRLVDGCFNRPKRFADRSELIWGTAYLLMALCYLEEGEVPC
jgi:hypothetical protein